MLDTRLKACADYLEQAVLHRSAATKDNPELRIFVDQVLSAIDSLRAYLVKVDLGDEKGEIARFESRF